MKTFKCFKCKEVKPVQTGITTGYARDKHNHKICFDCCGKEDENTLKTLKHGGKTWLYLSGDTVMNWPGTLRIPVQYTRTGRHNIAGKRYDVWFKFSGFNYHGVQYGDNTQICHIQKIK